MSMRSQELHKMTGAEQTSLLYQQNLHFLLYRYTKPPHDPPTNSQQIEVILNKYQSPHQMC
jgi:hypothetical protein